MTFVADDGQPNVERYIEILVPGRMRPPISCKGLINWNYNQQLQQLIAHNQDVANDE